MANSYAALVCNVCNPEPWRLGAGQDVFRLGAYLPSADPGWQVPPASLPDFGREYQDWLARHDHHDHSDLLTGRWFRLDYC